MKFYKKVRFWGGLGIAIEPFFLTYLEKDWVIIGIVITISSLVNFKKK